MGTVNLGQVAALIKSVEVEVLPGGATPTVRNAGTKANAELVFGIPDTRNMIINILKNGYIQWPGMKSPLEDTSLHFEGYSWYEVNYRGNFFRAKGENAKAFSAKRLTKEQIKTGSYVFRGDEQEDAIRNIKGTIGPIDDGEASSMSSIVSGCFQVGSRNVHDSETTEKEKDGFLINFDAAKATGVSVAEENRSRNLTFTIWVLVKD